MLTYEQTLDADLTYAFAEGSRYFERRSLGHDTLRRLAATLTDLEVDYAIVGAFAMFYHGYRRFTHAIDLIVTPAGLTKARCCLNSAGYQLGEREHHLLDLQTGVSIKFLVSGTSSMAGGHLIVDVPQPNDASLEIDGIRFISIAGLLKLKLASGQVPYRLRDHADVQSIIQTLNLPEDFADGFEPALREIFREYWGYAQIAAKDDY
ncbi:MAG TPA: hypothetical protein VGM76_09960 [Lacipirellulaceae bacterium]|jgi:hypothetical protein